MLVRPPSTAACRPKSPRRQPRRGAPRPPQDRDSAPPGPTACTASPLPLHQSAATKPPHPTVPRTVNGGLSMPPTTATGDRTIRLKSDNPRRPDWSRASFSLEAGGPGVGQGLEKRAQGDRLADLGDSGVTARWMVRDSESAASPEASGHLSSARLGLPGGQKAMDRCRGNGD